MRFYLYQLNGKLGDMQENARKIASFTQNFKNDVCTLLPSLPLIQHPYSAVSRIGGFFERVKRHKLISKNTNIVYESLYKGEKIFLEKNRRHYVKKFPDTNRYGKNFRSPLPRT